jgi:hypothetical protein
MKNNKLMDENILTDLEQVVILGGLTDTSDTDYSEIDIDNSLRINFCKKKIFADCKKIC